MRACNRSHNRGSIMTETCDELLLERGLAPSRYFLDINHHLAVPHDMALPPPWNLPSRLFRFPIEIGDATVDGMRSVGLMPRCSASIPSCSAWRRSLARR